MLLQPGLTCWRTAPAERASFLLDNSTYFSALKAVVQRARRSIHLIGWAFDPLTQLEPGPDGQGPESDRIADLLKRLAAERPELDVRVLVWESALPIAASQHFFPHRARQAFHGTRVRFRLDATVPFGACHHQKMVVIDDQIAFCGGGDISVDRWDSVKHREHDRRRTMPWGEVHRPRHEVMALIEGPAARILGDLARKRWLRTCRASGDPHLPPMPPEPSSTETLDSYWPSHVAVDLTDVTVGVARTLPEWRDQQEVRETERLHLASIAAAKRVIYLENQYMTGPIYAEALAARLRDPNGPEVVLVGTAQAPSWFDHLTMDRTRSDFLRTLEEADLHGRFHAYCPWTRRGAEAITVHSKTSIIDDRLLRTGSTNLNNRSAGFDTECDVAVEPRGDDREGREAIERFRTRLVAHYIGCEPEQVARAHAELGTLAGAIEALDKGETRRLRPLHSIKLGPFATLIAAFHLGDPADASDSFKPWKRRRTIEAERRAFAHDLQQVARRDRPLDFDPASAPVLPKRQKSARQKIRA